MTIQIKKITFNEIFNVWRFKLWPERSSPIKTHSSMTLNGSIDMNVYNNTATYFGIFDKENLIAANSGHKSSLDEYRSRGLWVDINYRKKGLGKMLLQATIDQARLENCSLIWSIPRKQALSVYLGVGFRKAGDFFSTETASLNCYVIMQLERSRI